MFILVQPGFTAMVKHGDHASGMIMARSWNGDHGI